MEINLLQSIEHKNIDTVSYQLDQMNSFESFHDNDSLTKLLSLFRQMAKDKDGFNQSDIIFPLTETSPELENLSEFNKFYCSFECATFCDVQFPPDISFIKVKDEYVGFTHYEPIKYDRHDKKYQYPKNPGGHFTLYLLPEFRRQGLGTKITTDFITSKTGLSDKIFFDVAKDNQAGKKSLSKLPGVSIVSENDISTSYVVKP